MPEPFDPAKYRKRLEKPNTWGALKAMVEAAGVADGDLVHSIDVGPYACGVSVTRTPEGLEIEDDSAPIVERLPCHGRPPAPDGPDRPPCSR